jgi:hypothetical protein
LGWRRAARLATGNERSWWFMCVPPQTPGERCLSGCLAWAAYCLSATTFLVVFINLNVEIVTVDRRRYSGTKRSTVAAHALT